MSEQMIANRYELVKLTEDRFVDKTLVKDTKAYGKLRTLLSINSKSLNNPNIVQWFNSQSELFTSISSDHVVDFIDRHGAGEIMESPVIIVEEPGITLADLLSRGPIAPAAAQSIIVKILLGLNELHERGYLHLDIRPETIGVNESATEVKLLSLGNCVEQDSDATSLTPNTKYGAAECYSTASRMDKSTDIYSVGFLYYEMLCGCDSFATQFSSIVNASLDIERNTNWTNWHVSDKSLVPLDKCVSGMDERLIECVHTMTDKDQDKRYNSASTVINELNAIHGNSTSVGLTGSFSGSDKKKKKKFSAWVITGGAVGAAMSLGIAAFVFFSKQNQVDQLELDAVVATANQQRVVVKLLGLAEHEDVVNADSTFQLAKDAWAVDDMKSVLTHVKSSSALYAPLIQDQAPVLLQAIQDDLTLATNTAQSLKVEGVNLEHQLTANYESLFELEEKYNAYHQQLEKVSKAIKINGRSVVIGSTQEQIDQAFVVCKEISDACTIDWYQDELERTVSLTPFALDKNEVSVSIFREYAHENDIYTEAEIRNLTSIVDDSDNEFAVFQVENINWENEYPTIDQDLPVVHVTLNDAIAYCESVGQRLPTEAEWEYVASGQTRNVYTWGNSWDASKLYWKGTDDTEQLKTLGSFPASISGHFDLAGSVSEWTSSRDEDKENAFIKGASRFDSNVANIRVAVRRLESIDYSGDDVGFRCAKDVEEWPEILSIADTI